PPQVVRGIPASGSRAVIFFVRPAEANTLIDALGNDKRLRRHARLAIVEARGPAPRARMPVVADPGAQLARAYGMRTPNDGGYPIGYAVVDSAGRVRYATIDPEVATRLGEVATILAATP
ncbi:MAG: thioredoxin domain-containing protein, partial [Acidimicrobiales bacterium]